jgi:hypothetical protein
MSRRLAAALSDLGPDAAEHEVERAAAEGPGTYGPRGDDLVRYGWASAVLDHHPELLLPWATATDRAVRRAVMRSPALGPIEASALVATRRTGMHTLGANPATPIDLLRDNPGARRRRAAVDAVLPCGLAAVEDDPNDRRLTDLGSGTVDLAVARAGRLSVETARRLIERDRPPVDPWVLAVLGTRTGEEVWTVAGRAVSPARLRAARDLAVLIR